MGTSLASMGHFDFYSTKQSTGLPSLEEIRTMAATCMFEHTVRGCVQFSRQPCKTLEVEKPCWSVYVGRISRPVTDIPIRKTEISATRPAHLLIIYEHIKILTKEIVVRQDLGNRASPVN